MLEEEFLKPGDARDALGIPRNAPVVGWIGRFTPEKGPDVILDTMSMLDDTSVHLVMVGGGRMEADLRKQTRTYGMSRRVIWTGVLPGAARYLRAFDVLALTSRTEGTPMVLLEAMAAGVPIVARSVGGVGDMLNEGEAFLVSAPGVRAVASALELALGDRTESSRRAEKARARFDQEFSVGPWVQRHQDIYRALTS
jgi:glycosyltransferase involved in cell wall biosynthesis